MLSESLIAATESVRAPSAHLPAALKDVGIFHHEFQPQPILRQGFKKSSAPRNCLAVSCTHIFAAQADKAVVNVYNRSKGNQEATVPFPQKISCISFCSNASVLVLGLHDGRLSLWETATGRIRTSQASHLERITQVAVSADGNHIISASADSSIHIWSLPQLLTFRRNDDYHDNQSDPRSPVRTFAQHRAPVSCLSVGNSSSLSNNFVVSGSEDKICYIWDTQTTNVLKTVVLNEIPRSVALDPADRAAYFGSNDGGLQHVALINTTKYKTSLLSISGSHAAAVTELDVKDCWQKIGQEGEDAAECIAISYDGTTALTGHSNGNIVTWDLAKGRMAGKLTELSGQCVTNIVMETPVGFHENRLVPRILVDAVVKPRVALGNADDAEYNDKNYRVPADYVLHVRTSRCSSAIPNDEFSDRQRLLDDAIQALDKTNRADNVNGGAEPANVENTTHQVDRLQDEISKLKYQLVAFQDQQVESQRLDRDRMKRREEIGLQKRKAFFQAKQNGKDADAAMRPYMLQEKEIDNEPSDPMDIDPAQKSK